MQRLITFTLACILLFTVQAKAEITPQLLQEWSRQPNNVQWAVFNQQTNIQVVDNLDWQSSSLYDTYAYTTLNVNNGYVQSIDIRIKRGYEYTLTHEVGHALSCAGRVPYWWAFQPCFIEIWQKERYNNVMMAQGFDDIREYFACAYDMFIRFPQILKRTNPDTYNYMIVVQRYT